MRWSLERMREELSGSLIAQQLTLFQARQETFFYLPTNRHLME